MHFIIARHDIFLSFVLAGVMHSSALVVIVLIMTGIIFAVLVVCVGDWHCAYVLLYGPRVLEVTEDIPMETEQQTSATEISS